ncbi:hypothetical protein CYLTODRAFT_381837 [Cylindrobasidium torrendii FP15055 ss-10]|uniref:Uncharacterized protein n=1 Tax=Cylindrobasidium torrendii FP15055 ss-10 TaxID=1314674 RepID=A0A0D7AZT1_9AGAR|nr:hypothetical protein CYLTODRAFT_381837 [Cylindrobasidium torrendii FP15055 ss-10]
MEKGVYTTGTRALVRELRSCGCSRANIGRAIAACGRAAQLTLVGNVSRRTATRSIKEGGIAAKVQIGYEVSRVHAVSGSGDSTSHKSVDYGAEHITLLAPNYKDPSQPDIPKTRVLDISSNPGHRAEHQRDKFEQHIGEIGSLLANCPFAKRYGIVFTVTSFLKVLKGWNSDHAPDQKKLVRLVIGWKGTALRIEMGYDELIELDTGEAQKLLDNVRDVCEVSAGGKEKWKALPDEERNTIRKASMDALALRLGEERYQALSSEDKRDMDLFFWAGCSMHKELNSVVGGAAEMSKHWDEFDLTPPVLLANKDNDAAIEFARASGESSEASRRAEKESKRGAGKFIQLAGSYFRNKDDKKGAHDDHRDFFYVHVGENTQFPDIANSRYHTICLGCVRVFKFLDQYRLFMAQQRDRKGAANFSHMEQNVNKSLYDTPTIEEAVCYGMYYMLITGSYAIAMRGGGTSNALNMLEQGPFHENVLNHVRRLITNPLCIFGYGTESSDELFESSVFLAGEKVHGWLDVDFVDAVLAKHRLGDLPNLIPLLTRFLIGTLQKWIEFTEEFRPGGAIATATAAERQSVHIPTANDANEGLLGCMRRTLRASSVTIGQFCLQAMYTYNGTQDFMDALFTEEDHRWLLKTCREIDRSGEEKRRREGLVEYGRMKAVEHRKKLAARADAMAEKARIVKETELCLDRTEVDKMTKDQLQKQINVWRTIFDDVAKAGAIKNRPERLCEVVRCMERYLDDMDTAATGSGEKDTNNGSLDDDMDADDE